MIAHFIIHVFLWHSRMEAPVKLGEFHR